MKEIYIFQINQQKQKNINNQPETLPQPSTNIHGKKIRMSGLDMTHRKLYNISEGNFKDQWIITKTTSTNN